MGGMTSKETEESIPKALMTRNLWERKQTKKKQKTQEPETIPHFQCSRWLLAGICDITNVKNVYVGSYNERVWLYFNSDYWC